MVSERVILHSDMNSFYASCEMAYHPELRGKPIAVCGDPERRNGIVLTASYPAKRMGGQNRDGFVGGSAALPRYHLCPGSL